MAKELRMMDIMLTDVNNTFHAGGNITGQVYLDVCQELKYKSIKLHLQGVSCVTWNEKKSYTKGSASKTSHKDLTACFDSVHMIKGSPGTLSPRRYDWRFNEPIPAFCPGSFEGQWGRVQYFAKITIERSFGKTDLEMMKHFSVRGVLDLNLEDEAKSEVANEGTGTAGFICCKSGPIEGSIYLSKQGYVPPEPLPFTVDLRNYSRCKCIVKVVLSQQAIFRADGQIKRTNTPLKGISYRSTVVAGEKIHWEDQFGSIPPVQPSRLGGGCKSIDIKYILTLVISPSGPGSDLNIPVEVVIGTVPLRKAESGHVMLTVKAAAARTDLAPPVTKPRASPQPQRAARHTGD